MKQVPSDRPGQEKWLHGRKLYSVVDLTAWPEKHPEPEWSRFTELMKEAHQKTGDGIIEVALIPYGSRKRIQVLGRYDSLEEARKDIESGGATMRRSFWS